MKLENVRIEDTAGTILVHNLADAQGHKLLSKGHLVTAEDIDKLRGTTRELYVARLEPAKTTDSELVRPRDCTLDVTRPEALRYVESGQGLRLVAVEYGIPFACASDPPEDFLSGIGEWEQEPDVPVWTKTVWIWSGGSIGTDTRH